MKPLPLSLLCPDCKTKKDKGEKPQKQSHPQPLPDTMRHHAVTPEEKNTKFCQECLHPYLLNAHYKEPKK